MTEGQERLQDIKSKLVKGSFSHGLSWEDIDWLIQEVKRLRAGEREILQAAKRAMESAGLTSKQSYKDICEDLS